MAIHDRPRTHADEAGKALRLLAHATRNVDDATEIHPVLGELSNGLASLAQSLHQIGDFHEGLARNRAWITGDARTGRAESYKVSWELHRAAEMARQVAECVDRAHEVEATIAYDIADYPSLAPVHRPLQDRGLSL